MRIRFPVRAFVLASFLMSAFANAAAQQNHHEQIIVPMRSGFFVAFSSAPSMGSGGAKGWSTTFAEAYLESNTIRRVFIDNGGTLYYGYSLLVEPLASSKQFRVSIRPLSAKDEQELRARTVFQTRSIHPNYNAEAVSRFAAPQLIADGDTFALEVLVNPKTGDKVTDYVTVSMKDDQLKATPERDIEPRDFMIQDVEMKMINYKLLVNGELVAGGKRSGACAGPVIWFHLTGRGRFIFSLRPQEGYDFQNIGVIERNKIKFVLSSDRYEWISDVPVVGPGGPWNLYVLYDPNYVPESFFFGVRGAEITAKGGDTSSALSQVERTMRLSKRPAPTSLDKPSSQGKTSGEAESPGARLIIGAAGRVENLLPANTGPFSQPGLKDAYAKWLYEDVAYLITLEESLAFRQLGTDEQREMFIDQFWRRRDLDPATTENEFRREHYARFAYANEQFAFSNVAGWRTDRGRIYILRGKPSEVEQTPSGERWLYSGETNVTYEFVRFGGTGELYLKPATQ